MSIKSEPFKGKVIDVFEDYKTKLFEPFHIFAANPSLKPTDTDLGISDLFVAQRDVQQHKDARRLVGKVHPFYLIAMSQVAAGAPGTMSLSVGESYLGPYLSIEGEEGDELARITTHFKPVDYTTDIRGIWFPSRSNRDLESFSGLTHLLGWTSTWMGWVAEQVMGFFTAMALYGDPAEYSHVGTYVTSSLDDNSRVTAVFLFKGAHVSITTRPIPALRHRFDSDVVFAAYRAAQRMGINDVPAVHTIDQRSRHFMVYDQNEMLKVNDGPNQVPALRVMTGVHAIRHGEYNLLNEANLTPVLQSEYLLLREVGRAVWDHIRHHSNGQWYLSYVNDKQISSDDEVSAEFHLYHRETKVHYRFQVRQKK